MTKVKDPGNRSEESELGLTTRSVAVGCITLTRYLRTRDPDLSDYLGTALANATESGLSKADLALLKIMVETCASSRMRSE